MGVYVSILTYTRNNILPLYSQRITKSKNYRTQQARNIQNASNFIDFVGFEQGQKIIREYGADKYGEGLYNDAAYAKQFDH